MFVKPQFEPGINITVRLGTKWYSYFYKNSNDGIREVLVELATPDGVSLNKIAVIEHVEMLTFNTIRSTILELEHDPACRNLRGLYNELKSLYGKQFHASSLVTIIYFTVD
jgi:hypothetical protein